MSNQSVLASSTRSGVRRFLSFFFCVFALSAVWSFANPMFASPDEGQHMVRAEGIVRGQFESPYRVPSLPVGVENCYALQPTATADCMVFNWTTTTRDIETANDNYPPLFHALIGVPTLVFQGEVGAYAMRLTNALLCSVLIGLALNSLARSLSGVLFVVAATLSLTPMIFFVSGTVNPSGLAASSGLAVFSALAVADHLSPPRTADIHLAGSAALILLLIRRDSVYWAAVCAFVLLVVCGRSYLAGVLRTGIGKFWLAACTLAAGYSFITSGRGAGNSFVENAGLEGTGSLKGTWNGIAWLTEYLRQHFGKFGWLDTDLPEPIYILCYVLLGSLVLLAATLGTRRRAAEVAMMATICVVIPVAIGYLRFPYFQARYMFPVSMGLVPIAARALSGVVSGAQKRLRVLLLCAFVVIQVGALAQNLRRYAVGRFGTWLYPLREVWDPRVATSIFWLVAGLVIAVMYAVLVYKTASTQQSGRGGT